MAGLDDLKGLLQPKRFYDSVITISTEISTGLWNIQYHNNCKKSGTSLKQ